MVGYQSYRLCDRDIKGDTSIYAWNNIAALNKSLKVMIVVIICSVIIVTLTARVNHY